MTVIFSIAAIMLSVIIGYILYIKTDAGDAVSSITSSPILKKILKWFIVIILLFISYQILAFVGGFIPWDKFSEHLPNTPNLPDFSFNFENSFFTTWDWTTFPWVQTHLGSAGDTIIWTLVVLAIFWIITSLFQRKIEYGISGWLFFILLVGTGAYIFVSAITNADKAPEAKVEKSSFVNARFDRSIVENEKVTIEIEINQTIRITTNVASPRRFGEGMVLWACPKVTVPEKLMEKAMFVKPQGEYDYIVHFRLSDETQQMFLKYGILSVTVEFTQTLGRRNKNPCIYLIK